MFSATPWPGIETGKKWFSRQGVRLAEFGQRHAGAVNANPPELGIDRPNDLHASGEIVLDLFLQRLDALVDIRELGEEHVDAAGVGCGSCPTIRSRRARHWICS